jgi:hypothetical protein
MGPAGRVANGALGAGMSGGFMAGLAGLGGGLAALAISKAVGAVVEKVGAVEAENIKHDRIKRRLGDVGVGFGALKASIRGASSQMGVTFDEGQDLVAQYIKTAGITNRGWRSAGDETATAGNFGRSFGVDQSQAVGAFGALRQFGVTNNDQQARRMALLIAEGISKSDAFSKADEVLEAIAGYTAQQTRTGMNSANVEGYTSMLSGMVGSKIPGMDVASSAALLSRMNSSISGGGSAGEAGQNFLYSALGGRGMDPMDVTLLREQGLFGTGRSTFGAGSTYGRYAGKYGLSTPDAATSDTTNFESIQKQFEKNYGGSATARKLMANAMANLYGITNSQAMAISTVNPAQLGGMGKRLDRLGIDVKDVNATGISRMAQIEGDSSLSNDEKDKRMRQAATEGQEQTAGSIAKDSKAALENIQSTLADKLLPATQAMRDGIMYLAGGKNGMSTRDIRVAMMGADSDDKARGIGAEFDEKMKAEAGKPSAIRAERAAELASLKRDYDDPEKRAAHQKRVQELSDKLAQQDESSRKRVIELMDERKKALSDNADALKRETKAMDDEEAARRKAAEAVEKAKNSAQDALDAGTGGAKPTPQQIEGMATPGVGRGGSVVGKDAIDLAKNPELATYLSETDRLTGAKPGTSAAQAMVESTLNPQAVSPAGARGLMQIMPSTQTELERRAGRKFNAFDPMDSAIMQRMVMQENVARFGNVPDAQRAYNGGWDKSAWGNAETSAYAGKIATQRERMTGTPIPDTGAPARSGDQSVSVAGQAEITVKHEYADGRRQGPDQRVNVRLAAPQPSGM